MLVLALLGGCVDPPQVGGLPERQRGPVDDPPQGPAVAGSRVRPELVQAVPEIAAYGGEVQLNFAEGVSRGRPYALERRENEGWVWVFSMTSDVHSSDWWYAGTDVDVPDDVHTDTAITLPVPHRAPPGEYRICTTDGDCAALAIGPPSDAEVCRSPAGSATEVLSEPGWRGSGDYREWTDAEGCLVRVDVVADADRPAQCVGEKVRVLVTGMPVGERFSSAKDAIEYVRDPDGVLDEGAVSGEYQADVQLPDDARDTGLRHDDTELWAAADGEAVYLVGPEATERLPQAELPECA